MQPKIIPLIFLACGALLPAGFAADSNTKGVAITGRSAFEKRCSSCHALDHDKEGPRLAGVVGRKAGAISSFPYSDALKKSSAVWNEAALDKWLADPEVVIPDSDMAFRLNNAAERAAIIAYLKETGK